MNARFSLRPIQLYMTRLLQHCVSPPINLLVVESITKSTSRTERSPVTVSVRSFHVPRTPPGAFSSIETSHNDSKHALATFRYIGDQLIVTKNGQLSSSPGSKAPDMWRNACNFVYDDRTWKALLHFIKRIWFYRLWCWQEIKLSSSRSLLRCGHGQITWPVLRRAILCLHNKEKLPSLMFRERCRHDVYLTADAVGHSMSTLLDLSRSKGCANPRNKIPGLLGLTAPSFNARLRTNYASPVEDVYKDAFLAHLAITRRLELLKHCVLSRRSIGGPSWVPDWSKTDFAALILSEQLSTGLLSANFKYVPPNILEITGLRQRLSRK
ncbi:hypothetical protein BU16DRAFT_75211 [Lophium mytilinum]|uniref:Heterokaryon incompatibility domain-containing protein n=1 Tax=Lophium mytilinum TaxID=390894 RepID=A0A6A6QMA3_9PEZI|nr:hypothetical protein BU16DRAFT_75211 [Lophium mytilinum]